MRRRRRRPKHRRRPRPRSQRWTAPPRRSSLGTAARGLGGRRLASCRRLGKRVRRGSGRRKEQLAAKQSELEGLFGEGSHDAATKVQAIQRGRTARRKANSQKHAMIRQVSVDLAKEAIVEGLDFAGTLSADTDAAARGSRRETQKTPRTARADHAVEAYDVSAWTSTTTDWRSWCEANGSELISPRRTETERRRKPPEEVVETKLLKAKFKELVGRASDADKDMRPADILFKLFDKDESGSISLEEFRAGMVLAWKAKPSSARSSTSRGPVTSAQVKKLFKMIDADGSGDIDLAELISFVWGAEYTSEGALAAQNMAAAKKAAENATVMSEATAIARVDPKLDGLPPSNKELTLIKTRMQALSYDTGTGARQDPERVFKLFDYDDSGELNMAEFIAAVRKGGRLSKQTLSDSGIRWLFRKIDKDNSGAVDIAELKEFVWGGEKPWALAEQRRFDAEEATKAAKAATTGQPCTQSARGRARAVPQRLELKAGVKATMRQACIGMSVDELNLEKGAPIQLLSKRGSMWRVRDLKTGKKGSVPSALVSDRPVTRSGRAMKIRAASWTERLHHAGKRDQPADQTRPDSPLFTSPDDLNGLKPPPPSKGQTASGKDSLSRFSTLPLAAHVAAQHMVGLGALPPSKADQRQLLEAVPILRDKLKPVPPSRSTEVVPSRGSKCSDNRPAPLYIGYQQGQGTS